MKLLDKLVLALKSAVNDVVGEDVALRGKDGGDENTLRLIEKAQTRIDILRKDAERADKRGDAELAAKIRKEAAGLQKTVDKTRQRLGQVARRESAVTAVEDTQSARGETRKEQKQIQEALEARDEAAAKREDNAAARDAVDRSRISDLLKQDHDTQP
jgi:hypothetical protein